MRLFLLPIALLLGTSSLAAQTLTLDAHVDLPASATTPGWSGLDDPTSQFDLVKAKAGGLNAAAVALFVPQGPRDPAALAEARAELTKRDAAIHAIADKNPERAALALSPTDVRRIVASGRFAVIESMLNTWPLGDDLDQFDHWYARGVRMVGFVHAGHNQFADSSRPALQFGDGPARHHGLSPLGKAAVRRLNDIGILIDVSQLSDEAFDQTLRLTRAPVIASHSDVRALVDTSRNLSDAQLDALKTNGGVVAINAFGAYLLARTPATLAAIANLQRSYGLSPAGGTVLSRQKQAEYDLRYHAILAKDAKATVAELIDAVDHAVKRIGIDHVALSSDFNHGGGVVGWKDESETGNVTTELKRRGYTPAQIEKLWGGNVLRIWQAAIDARRPG